MCKFNGIPFDATGEKIRREGLWCVYQFGQQLDAMMAWDRFQGRWLREFTRMREASCRLGAAPSPKFEPLLPSNDAARSTLRSADAAGAARYLGRLDSHALRLGP
jgi:hypothetical protein